MSDDWILLAQAAEILKSRGQQPRACISELITKRFWKPVLAFQEWSRSNGRWLGRPEFDINTSRMVVEVHTLRRGPAAIDAARQWREILVSKTALDELWPEAPPQANQTGSNRVNQDAKKYFSDVIARGERINEESAFSVLKDRFPRLSRNFFDKGIWNERPDLWKKPGPIPGKKAI